MLPVERHFIYKVQWYMHLCGVHALIEFFGVIGVVMHIHVQ